MEAMQQRVPRQGIRWAMDNAKAVDQSCRDHLETQGRGGTPPPLSSMTRQIYAKDGEPDGSGIVDHLTLEFRKRGDKFYATLGIPNGKPAMIAKVQDRGTTVRVTEKMRGFLSARYGIHLRQETTHINIPGRHFWERSLRRGRSKAMRELKRFFREVTR
ncbi:MULTISPECIES: hypothetical protein [Trichocoleus]|nr:hypothetical protein [Trichocoleus sp. FACHB-46]